MTQYKEEEILAKAKEQYPGYDSYKCLKDSNQSPLTVIMRKGRNGRDRKEIAVSAIMAHQNNQPSI